MPGEDQSEASEDLGVGVERWFTYAELAHATGQFGEQFVLGTGQFGTVYKGQLSDGTAVAIKRLKDAR